MPERLPKFLIEKMEPGARVERVKRSIRERNVSDTYRDSGIVFAVQEYLDDHGLSICSVRWDAGRPTKVKVKYLRVVE